MIKRTRSSVQAQLELKLAEVGITECSGWNIARGWWLSAQADVQRWQCWAQQNGHRVLVGSWDSMGDCVRRGFTIRDGNEAGGYTDVDVMSRKVPA